MLPSAKMMRFLITILTKQRIFDRIYVEFHFIEGGEPIDAGRL